MTDWEKYDFAIRVRDILKRVAKEDTHGHHLGVRFLTGYQIAIEFNKLYPEDVKETGLLVGGRNTGKRVSLAQYIANQLSRRLKKKEKELSDVEGAFLSKRHVKKLVFSRDVVSSTEDLAMFRLTKPALT
jgi:hypothetical protein